MSANETTDILAYQRIAGNAHELEGLKASLNKLQARLSATEDDDAQDALISERKSVKARIEGFKIIDDDFGYANAADGRLSGLTSRGHCALRGGAWQARP